MKNEPLVSVIIPVFNSEQYLCRCIDSIINQTYKNLEIVLVDDGATDGSPTICEGYRQKDSRILTIHKKNNGVSSARNVGLDLANGEFISFVDSDDYIDEECIAKAVMHIGVSDICCYSLTQVFKNDNELQEATFCDYVLQFTNIEVYEFVYRHWQPFCACLYRKSLIEMIGLRYKESVHYGEDRIFFLTYILHVRSLIYIPYHLYYYNIGLNISNHNYQAILDYNTKVPECEMTLELFKKMGIIDEIGIKKHYGRQVTHIDLAIYTLYRLKTECIKKGKFKSLMRIMTPSVRQRIEYLNKQKIIVNKILTKCIIKLLRFPHMYYICVNIRIKIHKSKCVC